MKKNFVVLAWDNGNSNEKFIYRDLFGEISGVLFPSLTAEIFDNDILSGIQENNIFSKNNMKLDFEGNTYCVGKLAQEQDSKGGVRDQLTDKYKTSSTISKLLAGVSLILKDLNLTDINLINIENLMLGLSINMYEKHRKEIINFYKNSSFTFKIPLKNGYKEYTLSIQNVYCIAQGVGAFYDEVLEFSGYPKRADLLKKRYLLIDGGGGTTEYFIADGKKPIFGTGACISMGANDIFEKVGTLFNNAPGQIIEKVYRESDSHQYWGSKEPLPVEKIQDYISELFQERSRHIYQTITNDLKEHLNRVGTVLVCGGIVDYIYIFLQELFNDRFEVIRSNHPIFSNARGYYKYYKLINLKKNLKKVNKI